MSGIDLPRYFARIGFAGAVRTDYATLRALHLAHVGRIPFENIDVRLGIPIRLDPASLEDKLVRRRRGGYCFEHNSLFLAVLRAIGFDAAAFEARVRFPAGPVRPRTHMLLQVRLGPHAYLADVGFGGQGPLEPVPMAGAPDSRSDREHRVIEEGRERVLQWHRAEGWSDLYAFVPEERPPVDFEMANHFTSTNPASPFVQTLTAQLSTPEARHVVRDRTYQVFRGGVLSEERLLGDAELRALLAERFGLEWPAAAPTRPTGG